MKQKAKETRTESKIGVFFFLIGVLNTTILKTFKQ